MFDALRQLFARKINRVFISYSTKDSARVVPLVELMRVTGANVFRDADNIPKGKKWRKVLESELQNATCLVLFWTKNAAGSSEVMKEIDYAYQRGIDIVPIVLEPVDVPERISEFQGIKLYTTTIEYPSLPPGTVGLMRPHTVVHLFSERKSAHLILERLHDRTKGSPLTSDGDQPARDKRANKAVNPSGG